LRDLQRRHRRDQGAELNANRAAVSAWAIRNFSIDFRDAG
jgi:hypothetical protein